MQPSTPLIIYGSGLVFKAVPKLKPVREKKGDPLKMVDDGWTHEGCPLAKIVFYHDPTRKNPILDLLRSSGMVVAEVE